MRTIALLVNNSLTGMQHYKTPHSKIADKFMTTLDNKTSMAESPSYNKSDWLNQLLI